MSAMLKKIFELSVNDEITSHPAWMGNISGLKAEKMLRGKNIPYLYVLRQGEHDNIEEVDYYVSFILPDMTVHHQPFVITMRPEGWYFENASAGGPYNRSASINDVLHLMMHCKEGQNKPLIVKR